MRDAWCLPFEGSWLQRSCHADPARFWRGDARSIDRAAAGRCASVCQRSRGYAAARRLVARGEIVITQRGVPVDPSTARGPIRLRKVAPRQA
ncbi:MAG: DUF3253 domain-containing protein [Deltaproteobacteria bacterium]|nr:DUF3253 domain-containing protein [Deltaproteobacteria bacterium]